MCTKRKSGGSPQHEIDYVLHIVGLVETHSLSMPRPPSPVPHDRHSHRTREPGSSSVPYHSRHLSPSKIGIRFTRQTLSAVLNFGIFTLLLVSLRRPTSTSKYGTTSRSCVHPAVTYRLSSVHWAPRLSADSFQHLHSRNTRGIIAAAALVVVSLPIKFHDCCPQSEPRTPRMGPRVNGTLTLMLFQILLCWNFTGHGFA
jgi:hypothetical protein